MELVILSLNPFLTTPRPDPVMARSTARLTHSFEEVFHETSTASEQPTSDTSLAPALKSSADTYTVRQGDTLWGICEDELERSLPNADARAVHARVKEVVRANNLTNPDQLQIGQQLRLGSETSSQPTAVSTTPPIAAQPAPAPPIPSRIGETELTAPAPMVPVQPQSEARAPEITPPAGHMKTQPLEPSPIPIGGPDAITKKRTETLAASTTEKSTSRPIHKVVADLSALLQNLLDETGTSQVAASGRSPWKSILESGESRLTSEFGMRKDPFTGSLQHHDGVDIAAAQGTKIYPYKAGRVAFSGWDGGYGKVVKIHHDDGTETRYGHASALLVEPGQRVTQDTAIAKVGLTGRTTGPHLHFEIRVNGRPVDPVPYLKTDPVQLASAAYR